VRKAQQFLIEIKPIANDLDSNRGFDEADIHMMAKRGFPFLFGPQRFGKASFSLNVTNVTQ
jgi:tRNA(Glu) U13 pseudouridine synthase TruD